MMTVNFKQLYHNKLNEVTMETIIKDIKLPKEVTEIQEALPLPEPEPQGIGVGTGIGIVAIVVILAAAFAKYKCKK